MILRIGLIFNKYYKVFANLNPNKIFKRNLILIKDLYQEMGLMELSNNVKVKMIINVMQLNELNKHKDKLILMKFKYVKKLDK